MENVVKPNPEELNKALEKYHEIIQAAELNSKNEVESLVGDILCRIEAKDPRFMMNLTIHDGTDDNLFESPTARLYFDTYLSITELDIDELSAESPPNEQSGLIRVFEHFIVVQPGSGILFGIYVSMGWVG